MMILHVSNQIFCQCQFLIPAFLSSRPTKDQVLHIHLVTQVWITINCSQSAPLKTDHWKKNIILLPAGLVWSMSLLDLCTNSALPYPWLATLLALRRAPALVGPVAPASTVCRHQPAGGLGPTAPQSFTSAATTCEHFFHCPALIIPSPLSLSLSLYLLSPLPIGIVGRNFMFLAISFNNSRNDNTISNIQYPIYNIQYSICNIKQTSDEIKEK